MTPMLTRQLELWRTRTVALSQGWGRFRRGRLFLPAVIAAPTLALSGGVGIYAAWDSTRVDVPHVVGETWASGVSALESLELGVAEIEAFDTSIDPNCYVITSQSVVAGTRVVPSETVLSIEIAPSQHRVPDVVGASFADAERALVAGCFRQQPTTAWCVPADFSGDAAVLELDALRVETGFTYDAETGLLEHPTLEADDDWEVCAQDRAASTWYTATGGIGVTAVVPLTTVPQASEPVLGQTVAAMARTADGCRLRPRISATFSPDPAALAGLPLPSSQVTSGWSVLRVSPQAGHALLCDAQIEIEVEWPSTAMPGLAGLHHVPESPQSATAATAALEAAGLTASCSGRGTVTRQVPAAGTAVPRGTSVTCVAELVVPNLAGLDPTTAAAVLKAAGLSGSGTGSGVVVSQSPQAGTIVTSPGGISYHAEQPRPVAVVGPRGGSAYYQNCTAARAAGAAPIYRGEPGYRSALDRDNDGVACE